MALGRVGGIAARRRLDAELVRRGLVDSRNQARALVAGYRVKVNGAFADKPARLVDPGDSIELLGAGAPYVSRGGEKLAAALHEFEIDPSGLRCLDAGASTGGFTHCLLERGAASVVAVDVGYGQLHETLRADARVLNLERTNIRSLTPDAIGGRVQLAVADLSFISLTRVLEPLVNLCLPGSSLVVLVKPQFEAGRAEASRGRGVIRDARVWRQALDRVATAAAETSAPVQQAAVSPIRGGQGNVEFLYHLRLGGKRRQLDLDRIVDSAGDLSSA